MYAHVSRILPPISSVLAPTHIIQRICALYKIPLYLCSQILYNALSFWGVLCILIKDFQQMTEHVTP